MRWLRLVGLIVGVVLLGLVLLTTDWREAGAAVLAAGPAALLVIALWHLLVLGVDTYAWQQLVPRHAPGFAALFLMRWIGESVNNLAPVAQIGGEVLRGLLLARQVADRRAAVACVAADFAATAAALAPVAWLGVALLEPVYGALLAAACACAWLLWRAVRSRAAARPVARLEKTAMHRSEAPHRSIAARRIALLERKLRRALRGLSAHALWRAWGWHLAAWILGAGEIYLGFALLAHPVSLLDALMIECVLQTARSIAFAVPAAIGVQEGAIVALAGLLGAPAGVGAGLALLKRAREISLGVAGLALAAALEWRYRAMRRPLTR